MGTPTRLGAHFLWVNNLWCRLPCQKNQGDFVVIVRKKPFIFF